MVHIPQSSPSGHETLSLQQKRPVAGQEIPPSLLDSEEAARDQALEAAHRVDDARAAEAIRAKLRQRPTETGESWIDEMKVRGFESSKNTPIPPDVVKQFLGTAIGDEALRTAKMDLVTKGDEFFLNIPKHLREDDHYVAQLRQRGKHTVAFPLLACKNKEEYEREAMILEGVSRPEELRHIYNVRAYGGMGVISLQNLSLAKSGDFDYIDGIDLKSEKDRMRAVMLGIMAHEFIHLYLDRRYPTKDAQYRLPPQEVADYQKIMKEEQGPQGKPYVSDYVRRHVELYESHPDQIFEEDVADSVRIYVTNSKYLRQNYPRRLAFVQKYLPFLKPDTVVPAVKRIQKLN